MADVLLTLAEAGKTTDPLTAGIQTILVQETPVLDMVPWETLPQGKNSYGYFEETNLPTATFRAVNSGWDADYGIIIPQSEPLSILGGEVEIDQYIIDTMGGKLNPGIKARQYAMKARAAKEKWLETFFEGDTGVDPNGFDGLRARVTGTSLDFEMHASNATALTLAKLDEVDEAVVGGPTARFMNAFIKRKINALMRAAGQAREQVGGSFGRQYDSYADVANFKIQRENDLSSILAFDEDPGDGGDDASSIYCVRFGDEHVMGILGHGGAWDVKDFGEQEAAPRVLGRLSVYPGLVTRHPRSFARLHAVGEL